MQVIGAPRLAIPCAAPPPKGAARRKNQRGFTLVELLVALMVMAMLAVLSWRGLDGMNRAQTRTQQRADEVLTLQAGLSQWSADLDAVLQLPNTSTIDWNGRSLRLVRRSSEPNAIGPLVVAWSLRNVDGTDQWLRWQSPMVRNREGLTQAWANAAQWAQNPGDEARRAEVALTPLIDWQVFYYRDGAWSNPQSNSATTAQQPAAATSSTAFNDNSVPEGVRLVLTLPPGQALSGVITRDWVRPTVGGGKS